MTKLDDDEFHRIEVKWKSDVDLRLDRLCSFVDRYQSYLELCIERESDKKRMRQAVIEKTLIGLAWGGVVFIGVAIWNYLRAQLR